MLLTHVDLLDEILEAHAAQLGRDFHGYRNHALRVINFTAQQVGRDRVERDPTALHRIVIAAAFHDLGIWIDGTFDYLPPSEDAARRYLAAGEGVEDVATMIRLHHKITPCGHEHGPLPEAFRRADLVDVTRGAIGCGVPRAFRREVFQALPNQGFHRCLLRLSCKRLLTHPWSPLPMLRW